MDDGLADVVGDEDIGTRMSEDLWGRIRKPCGIGTIEKIKNKVFKTQINQNQKSSTLICHWLWAKGVL